MDAIRIRAAKFVKEFEGITSEKRKDQDFMRGFCHVFGISPKRIEWQYPVKDKGKPTTWIDGFLPRLALFEIKSAGEDLEKAYKQAIGYIQLIPDRDLPELVIICDFVRLQAYSRTTGEQILDGALKDLPANVDSLKLLAGYEAEEIQKQKEANEAAAEKIGRLHDIMKANKYRGKDLETYLVRLLFCLFADDTGLFGENNQFLHLLENTSNDGTDLHGELMQLFAILNQEKSSRPPNLPERFHNFPYVNGDLFAGDVAPYYFDEESRGMLIELAKDDWSNIDPSIFGSLFQAIMHYEDEEATAKTKKRREWGAHYTSEDNILKVIDSLFMNELRSEFSELPRNKKALDRFHEKLQNLNLFDPACGCGNFLVVAYRELRLLELEVIGAIRKNEKNLSNIALLVRLKVNQFHGIEIDSTAARIATVAMWLTDHQMNLKLTRFGEYMHRLPLTDRPNIVCSNALRIDWASVIAPEKCSYIMGNPPFIGRQHQTDEQKKDMESVFSDAKNYGVLDYVTAWYLKASEYILKNPGTLVAFVSTNSITQGEQVSALWHALLPYKIHILFAHRAFRWNNEGRGVAAVHCVIIGFGLTKPSEPKLFDYEDIDESGEEKIVNQINPYLVDAPTILIDKRKAPLCQSAPEMMFGNMANDGGWLFLTEDESNELKKSDPIASKYIKPFLGADEFINNIPRYCLWLADSTANDRNHSQEIKRRVTEVKQHRASSTRPATQKLASTPYLFGEIRQTDKPYLLIPRHSSESRLFIPMGYLDPEVICGDANSMIPDASLYDFGILTSTMHNAWVRSVCGRIKSDFRYSNTVVYNNYTWPEAITKEQRLTIEKAAQAVLDARKLEEQRCAKQNQACSLATMYAPGNMPIELSKAHQALDKAVDAAYAADGYDKRKTSDADRVAFLFKRYELLTKPLLEPTTNKQRKSKKK